MAESEITDKHGIPLRLVIIGMFVTSVLVSVLVVWTSFRVGDQYNDIDNALNSYLIYQNDVYTVRDTYNDLSERARGFVVSGDMDELIRYFDEVQVQRSASIAVEELHEYLAGNSADQHLSMVVELNYEMSEMQYYAMRLAVEAYSYSIDRCPILLKETELSEADLELSADEQKERALEILNSKEYKELKDQMDVRITLCIDALMSFMTARHEESTLKLNNLVSAQRIMIVSLVFILLVTLIFVLTFVVTPIQDMIRRIDEKKNLNMRGSRELLFLAGSYNEMFRRMEAANDRLSYEATHDGITGLYNRSAYESARSDPEGADTALLIMDVDYFKSINDTYGHKTGDQVLVRVALTIEELFRDSGKVYRIGGDEFSILMMGVNSSAKEIISDKISAIAKKLSCEENGVPAVTLSVGCAFSDQMQPGDDLFKNADRALYKVKEGGRNSFKFYVPEEYGCDPQ